MGGVILISLYMQEVEYGEADCYVSIFGRGLCPGAEPGIRHRGGGWRFENLKFSITYCTL
jgi:hypothetical protein